MDLFYIFNILWRKKWWLLVVAISATVLTYLLANLMPPNFKSEAVISTGIIEPRTLSLERDNAYRQQFQVSSQFSNMVNRLESRTSIRQLTYDLLLHDLQALSSGKMPFQQPDKELWTFDAKAAQPLIRELQTARNEPIVDRNSEPRLRKIAEGFGYTYNNLSEQSNVYREGTTDYLKLIFNAEQPEYTAFAVNAWAENFVAAYNEERLKQEQFSVSFYSDLAQEKKQQIDSLSNLIAQYKRNRRIVDLEKTGTSLIAAQQDLELAREEERKKIEGLKKVVQTLDGYLEKEQVKIDEEELNSLLLRTEVSQLKDAKSELLDEYNLRGRNNELLAQQIANADQALNEQIKKIAAERVAKEDLPQRVGEVQDLYTKRIEAEVELLLTQGSVQSLNEALSRVEQRTISFVTDESLLEKLEGEKVIRTEEYLSLVDKMNESQRIALSSVLPLSIIEYGEVPDEPESSKTKIVALLGGIVATGILAVLFILLALIRDYWQPQQQTATVAQHHKTSSKETI